MKWFKHMVDSGDDPDIGAILDEFGFKGYYVFFRTLEIMSREFKIESPGELRGTFNWFLSRYRRGITKKFLINFFRFTSKLDRFRYKVNGKYIWIKSEKLKGLTDEYTDKLLKKSGQYPDNVEKKSGQCPPQRRKKKKKEEEKTINNGQTEIEFSEFWGSYPLHLKKQDSLKAFKALRNKIPLEKIAKATNGYNDYLKHKRVDEGFDQKPMHPTTFLRENRWEDYVDYEYKARL